MGAEVFTNKVSGTSPANAFAKAVKEAAYDYGHAGYTGTIAEKSEYVMIDLPVGMEAEVYAYKLIDDCDSRIDDKWGPCGCLLVGPDSKHKGQNIYLFFGWASS